VSDKNLMSSAAIPSYAGTGENEIEQERLDLIKESNMTDDDRKDFADKDGFPMHELWDRIGLLREQWDAVVLAHPTMFLNKDWFAQASKISTAIEELHESVGQAHFGDDEAEEEE